MTRGESITLMDDVFNNDHESDLQHRLLKMIVDSISNQLEQGQVVDDEPGKQHGQIALLTGVQR
jgi:hypothetical protein